MKITKLGHCCLLIEEKGVVVLTDPGIYSQQQNEITGIDVILITHEHSDHFHIESVKKIVSHNPAAKIITNTAVSKLLEKEDLAYQILENGNLLEEGGLSLKHLGKNMP